MPRAGCQTKVKGVFFQLWSLTEAGYGDFIQLYAQARLLALILVKCVKGASFPDCGDQA